MTGLTPGAGFKYLRGVAVDGSGNVYFASVEPVNGGPVGWVGTVNEIPPDCSPADYADYLCTITTLGGGFTNVSGLALDSNGNIYVTDGNAVKEMPPGCASASCVTTLGGGFNEPWGVAVDGSGNVYVSDTGNNAVEEMLPGCASTACVTTLGGGFTGPTGIAVDGSGNVYIADNGMVNGVVSGVVEEMPPGCGSSSCVTTLPGVTGIYGIAGVAVDESGNIYALYDNRVQEIMPHGLTPRVPRERSCRRRTSALSRQAQPSG